MSSIQAAQKGCPSQECENLLQRPPSCLPVHKHRPASVSSLSSEGREKIEENNDCYYKGSVQGDDSVFAAQVRGPEFRCPSVEAHA